MGIININIWYQFGTNFPTFDTQFSILEPLRSTWNLRQSIPEVESFQTVYNSSKSDQTSYHSNQIHKFTLFLSLLHQI